MVGIIAVLGVASSSVVLSSPASAQNDLGIAKFNQPISDEFVPGQVVVGLKKSDPNFHKGGKVINTIDEIHAFVVKVPEHTEDKFIFSILKNPIVDYAEKDPVLRAFYDPEDPFYTTFQWGMKRIGSELAWNTLTGIGSGVKVAVVDTGMNYNHVDLATRVDTINGYDFVDDDNVPLPSDAFCYNGKWEWHGTFVAGIIAGIDNDVGIVGASQVEIIPVRVLNNCGSGSSSDVADGIIWAANHGADVINLSLGGRSSSTMQNAVIFAYSEDIVIVASAGNSGSGKPSYPASYDEVISVSATDINDNLASYSTHNDRVELTAPGGDSGNDCFSLIVSSGFKPNDPEWDWMCSAGTSFSAPHVSGVAALLWAQSQGDDTITNQDIRNHLTLTAEDLGDSGRDRYFGYGMVRADLAVNPPISGVSLPNNPPVANDDSATTTIDTAVTIDVTANDTDVDGTIDPTTVAILSGPSYGTVSVNQITGVVTYTPNTSFPGTDSFVYEVADDDGATDSATVTITEPVNDPPVANNDSDTVDKGLSTITNVAANDVDVDDGLDLTSIMIETSPLHGTLTVNVNGTVTYAHDGTETTSDSYTYNIKDALGQISNDATVSITIIADTSLTASLAFSQEVKGKSGTANLFMDVTVSGSSGQIVTVYLELFKSSDGTSWTRVGTGSDQLNGDGTITFKYNKAQCGMQYKADTTASTTSGGSAIASGTHQVVC